MEIFSEKALIERIIGLRKTFAGERGRSKFAETLGISPSTYSYYENNRVPPIPILLKICQLCNVSIYWLLTGQNEAKSLENQPPHLLSQESAGDDKFSEILEKLKKLSAGNPVSLQAVTAFLELMEQKSTIESQVFGKSLETRPGWIPVLGRTAAGPIGMWNETNLTDSKVMETRLEELVARHINSSVVKKQNGWISADSQAKSVIAAIDNYQGSQQVGLIQTAQADSADSTSSPQDEICQFIDCPSIAGSYPDCFALQIDGDSMSPRIGDGDIVIVSPSVPASQGQPAIIRAAGAIGVTCKLLRIEDGKAHLIPINEKYETKIIKSDDLLWALAVLCHIRLSGPGAAEPKNVDL